MNYLMRDGVLGARPLGLSHNEKAIKRPTRHLPERIESLLARLRLWEPLTSDTAARNEELRNQLRECGLNSFDMFKSATFHLVDVLFPYESIRAAVSGRTRKGGSILMLITDLRIICIKRIPLFTDMDEFAYRTVNGISLEVGRFGSTVTLYVAIDNFVVRTMNATAAKRFVECVEKAAIESQNLMGRYTSDNYYANGKV